MTDADELERAPRWRDVADELPAEAQEVLFVRGGKTVHGAWIGGIFWHNNQKMAAAYWMPLPLPPNDRIQPRRVGVEKNETAHGNKDRRGDGEKGMTSDAVAGNMCPFCRAILGAPHEGWCTHARPDAVPPRVDVSALQSEIERLRAELVEANGQINRCVDQNKYLERLLAEAQRDVSIVTFLRCGGWEVLQNPKYWTPENKFFGAIAEAMADVAMEGK